MSNTLTRQQVSGLLKRGFGQIFLPNLFLFLFILFLNWLVIGIYVWSNWDTSSESEELKNLILIIYGSSIPAICIGIWCLRRIFVRFLDLVYQEIIAPYFKEFLENTASSIFHAREKGESILKETNELDEFNLILKFRNWMNPKLEVLPKWIKNLILFVFKKVSSLFEFQEFIADLEKSSDNRNRIQKKVEQKFHEVYKGAVGAIFPAWTKLLLWLNFIVLLLLFLIDF